MLDGLLAPGFADCFGVQTADFDYWEMGGGIGCIAATVASLFLKSVIICA